MRIADELSSLALKCTPSLFNSRNLANFLVDGCGGDPGGEGGMSKFDTWGIVKVRILARVAEYGDDGADVVV